jgi:hypothetical protein
MKLCKNPDCRKEFEPILNGSGIALSNYCRECDYQRKLSKRIEQMGKRMVREEQAVKTASKSNCKVVRDFRTTQIKTQKQSEKTLKRKLDDLFSLFIRQRDADENGMITCISSGKKMRWQDSDCGHYINRRHMSTRYDEINCNAQGRSDNRFDEGNIQGYRKGLIKKYGLKAVEDLEMRKFNKTKITQFEYEILIKLYKEKIKQYEK